ncbi:hypothetical protein LOD99_1374 [Oopsacas minuta]|uniref:G domain-containing protein n=1 Tax=Oopsacas minuta TaxID=111878 RepID=A0AAV7K5Q7_9METZ|nr:hypothetical protein LOD99_1374 [Oopsacas minuta]
MTEQCTFVKVKDLTETQTKSILEFTFPNEFKKINFEDLGDINGDILLSLTDKELKEDLKITCQDTRTDFLQLVEKHKRYGVPIIGGIVVHNEDLAQSSIKTYNQQVIIELALTEGKQKQQNKMNTKLLSCQITQSGFANQEDTVKQILILGETGCGKSALINSIANVLLKMEQSTQFRFKVIDNEEQTGTSSTDAIQGYKLEVKHSTYSYMFWDTPGFSNTNGFEHDMNISKSIADFLHKIQHLDAVVVVEKYNDLLSKKSSEKTKQVKNYLFNQMLSYFGKEIIPYVYLFLTFPSHYEEILPDLTEYTFPFLPQQVYTINNGVMFERESSMPQISKLFWDRNMKLISNFIDKLHARKGIQLEYSNNNILEQKHQLNVNSKWFFGSLDKMKGHTIKCQKLEDEKSIKEGIIRDNTNYYTEETSTIKYSVPTKKNTTYCTVCIFTCHADCLKKDKKECEAFDKHGKCQYCPKKCPAKHHEAFPYIVEEKQTTKQNVNNDKKIKFDQAMVQLTQIEAVIKNCTNEYTKLTKEALEWQIKVQSNLTELKRIAPYFDVDSTYNYLELIKQQKKSRHEHCTPFEIETFLIQYIVVRMSQTMSRPEAVNHKKVNPEEALEKIKSEIIELEKEMSFTSPLL